MNYKPPYTLSERAVRLVADISAAAERYAIRLEGDEGMRLRRINRIRSIHASCAIEANSLSLDEVTALLDGKRVIAPAREITEILDASNAYAEIEKYDATNIKDLLKAHSKMVEGLRGDAGVFRSGDVGVFSKEGIVHRAPPAWLVPELMGNLFGWLEKTEAHALVKAAVFHYEFEFIHPFSDGNGRTGRLWHSVILGAWNPIFFNLPIEDLIYQHQSEYYNAIQASTDNADSGAFIDFCLNALWETINERRIGDKISVESESSLKGSLKSSLKTKIGRAHV